MKQRPKVHPLRLFFWRVRVAYWYVRLAKVDPRLAWDLASSADPFFGGEWEHPRDAVLSDLEYWDDN